MTQTTTSSCLKADTPSQPRSKNAQLPAVLVAIGLVGGLMMLPLLLSQLSESQGRLSVQARPRVPVEAEPSQLGAKGRMHPSSPAGPVWRHPLGSGRAVVTSCFGLRSLHGRTRPHRGLDLRGGKHTFVRAMGPGVVKRAGVDPDGWGKYVEIRHGGGWSTLYAHLSGKEVSAGQRVSAAEVIGYVGSSGHSFGAHLHLEVRRDGRAYDPLGALRCSEIASKIQMKENCKPAPLLCPSGMTGLARRP